MCKVYTGYCGTSEIEHGLCACTVDNPLAKAPGFSLRTGAQTLLYLSHVSYIKMTPNVYFIPFVTFVSLRWQHKATFVHSRIQYENRICMFIEIYGKPNAH